MNSTLISLPPNWNPEMSFWEQNGQLAILPPFDKIYNIDKGGKESSKLATTVFFISEVNEDKNTFARVPIDMRKAIIQENYYPDIDWENPLLVRAIEMYPEVCLSAIGRTLKELKEALQKRAAYLRNIEYNLDTMKDIDNAMAKSEKIYADFEKIEQKFIDHEKIGRVRGGRTESAIEKKLL